MKIYVVKWENPKEKNSHQIKGFANKKSAISFKSHVKRGLISYYEGIDPIIDIIEIPITKKGILKAINYII